jgi:31-O-methyltransferase
LAVTTLTDVRLPNGLTVAQVNPWETAALYDEIFVHRCYARPEILLPPTGTIVDIGANIGIATLFFHLESPAASIVSIEPAPVPRRALETNVERHGIRAEVLGVAVDAERGRRPFTYYPAHTIASGLHAKPADDALEGVRYCADTGASYVKRAVTTAELEVAEPIDCDVVTLEEALRAMPTDEIGLLKIDAERCEHGILAGIGTSVWPKIAQVAAEIHDGIQSARRFREQLEAHDMQVVTEQNPTSGDSEFMMYARRRSLQQVA